MGGVLTIKNDCTEIFDVVKASIFTPGQGICLQRLKPKKCTTFKFDYSLAYGSWYDIEIIVRSRETSSSKTDEELSRYLKKGIYLSVKKTVTVSDLTSEGNLEQGDNWQCSTCKKTNTGSLALCEHCFTNKSQTIINVLSCIPIVGIPFSITNAVLQCGKAAQAASTADEVDAGLSVVFTVVDVATAPFIVGGLIKIPAKVAAETGIKLTAKTIFCEAGKPLLTAAGKELLKGEIPTGIKLVKAGAEKIMKGVS